MAKYGNKAVQRAKDREDAVKFFMSFINADCDHIAVENPVGIMSTRYRKPDDIIQPYHFGDSYSKTTCLWTKDLPKLKHTNCVAPKVEYREWTDKKGKKKRQDKTFFECWSKKDRQRLRSKTFPGIAKAIATQYSAYLLTTNQVQ